ncbi:MAG: SUMF1/EgtB/PvdO family nonheme iron enzyme [Polyangiaceae bacterium]
MSPPHEALARRIEVAHASLDTSSWRNDGDRMINIAGGTLHHKPDPTAPVERIDIHSFALGRHLVTVSAYGEFIEAGGYDDASYWDPAGWAWRLDEDIAAPRFWNEAKWAAYLVANHPVIGVSLYEAEAYASFRESRLPTTHEWERAARGDDARNFPWGDDWIDDACSWREYGPRGTVPIGVFPRGVSPLGVHELVGSVWQWTSDSGTRSGEEEELRFACGGAWNNKQWSIGCCRRNAYPPTARFSNLGFRLASPV